MKYNLRKITLLTLCALAAMGIAHVGKVSADEIVVSGNGTNSQNTVSVAPTNQTTSQQSNTAAVTNTVANTATTGDNTAANTTGAIATVKTGDSTSSTNVASQANQNAVTVGACCQTNTSQASAEISGNGAGSTNTIEKSSHQSSNVSVSQTATVHNTITKNLSTGNNTANNNGGSVVIKTGDIKSVTNITNGPINVSVVSVPATSADTLLAKLKIFGNGANSVNDVNAINDSTQNVSVNNYADVINTLIENYDTGHNSANHNVGNVTIETGNIASIISIINYPINVSNVDVNCHCQKQPEKQKEQPSAPVSGSVPATSSTSSSNTTSTSSGGASNSVSTGTSLPVTGNNFLVLALFGNIMMLLLGAYLRLRSGRSPGNK